MSEQLAAAIINARVGVAQARIAGMVAENQHRLSLGHSIAYDEGAFVRVIDEEQIGHNAVWEAIHAHRG